LLSVVSVFVRSSFLFSSLSQYTPKTAPSIPIAILALKFWDAVGARPLANAKMEPLQLLMQALAISAGISPLAYALIARLSMIVEIVPPLLPAAGAMRKVLLELALISPPPLVPLPKNVPATSTHNARPASSRAAAAGAVQT